mgnify:CR=1 FL=1
MRHTGLLYYRKMGIMCSGISGIIGFILSIFMFGMAFGFIHPIADAKEWYHVATYSFSAIVFFAIGIYNSLCLVDDVRPGFLKMRESVASTFALVGFGLVALGLSSTCWFLKIFETLQNKNLSNIVIFSSPGATLLIGGAFLILLSVKSHKIDKSG